MEKRIIFATGNQNKMKEIKMILSDLGMEILSMKEAGIDVDVEENGTTFEENAHLKARYVFERTGCITIADDSGLCVDALNGRPGVYSARYGGSGKTDADRVDLLLDELKDVPDSGRGAYFACAISVIFPGEEWSIFERCNGVIGHDPKGGHGFGYDPVFFVDGQSFSEMDDAEKDRVSHRGKALRELVRRLKDKGDCE